MSPAESQPVPPPIKGSSSLVFFVMVVLAVSVIGSGAVLFFFDPTQHGFYPVCLFHKLTGWNCPGCGATRAAYQLLHGHPGRALQDNALFVLGLSGLLLWTARCLVQRRRPPAAILDFPVSLWWTLLAVTVVFTVLRNLPAFAWLSP